jgi:hypothetical protein
LLLLLRALELGHKLVVLGLQPLQLLPRLVGTGLGRTASLIRLSTYTTMSHRSAQANRHSKSASFRSIHLLELVLQLQAALVLARHRRLPAATAAAP